MNIIDFNAASPIDDVFYGGDGGPKTPIWFDGDVWMLKWPKPTKTTQSPHLPYTTNPLSEYLGSQIYRSIGIPAHSTLLGVRSGKVVVACKDFTFENGREIARLVPFNEIKNRHMASDLDSYSGTGSGTLLSEVLDTLHNQPTLRSTSGVQERFWDMFIIDALIGNNDRNNGNWGLLQSLNDRSYSLAPVFDNGAAFFNKRSVEQFTQRSLDAHLLRDDAYGSPRCAFTEIRHDGQQHHIKPFDFITQGRSSECSQALSRIMSKIDMEEIDRIIDDIPTSAYGLDIMPDIQRDFYKRIIHIRYTEKLLPALENIAKLAAPKPHLIMGRADVQDAAHSASYAKSPTPKSQGLD